MRQENQLTVFSRVSQVAVDNNHVMDKSVEMGMRRQGAVAVARPTWPHQCLRP